MGINLEVDLVRVNEEKRYLDRETIGIIIPSQSGYEYPQVLESYPKFSQVFTPDKKYSYLYDSGFNIAPIKVTELDDNNARITVTTDEKIRSFYKPKTDIKSDQLNLSDTSHYDKVTLGMTNNFVIKVPNPQQYTLPHISLPLKMRDEWSSIVLFNLINDDLKSWSTKLGYSYNDVKFLPSTQGFNKLINLELDPSGIRRINPVDVQTGATLQSPIYDTDYSIHKEIDGYLKTIYLFSPYPVPMIASGSKEFNISSDPDIENLIYQKLVHDKELFSIESLIPGRFGERISIKFSYDKVNSIPKGRLEVLFDGKVVETYDYKYSLHDLFNQVNLDSHYIQFHHNEVGIELDHDIKYLGSDRRIEPFNTFYIYDKLKGVKTENITTDSIKNTLHKLFHEDARVDLRIYDLEFINSDILTELNSLTIDNNVTIVNLYERRSDLSQYPNLIFTYGYFELDGILIPVAYALARLIKGTFSSDFSQGVYCKDLVTSDENLIGMKFDGLKYYIDFVPHDIVTRIVAGRIHRRMYRLYDYLGTKVTDVIEKALELISEIRSDIPILEFITLADYKRKEENHLILTVEYKLPRLRPEKLTLNITLNILN